MTVYRHEVDVRSSDSDMMKPGSASLPCITVVVRRGAGAKKDSMCFCAIPLWITAGSFISLLVSETY